MQQMIVGTKYQIVIPKRIREKVKGIIPGAKVAIDSIDEKIIIIKPEKKSWLERTRGMMTKAWENIDPVAELEKGRDEWEERLREIEKNFK